MGKIKLFFALLASVIWLAFYVEQKAVAENWQVIEVRVASITVMNGPAHVRKVWTSTSIANDRQDWAVLVDTWFGNSVSLESFGVESIKSKPLIFPNTTFIDSSWGSSIDYGEEGILISSGVSVFKSTTNFGGAGKAYIEVRPGL